MVNAVMSIIFYGVTVWASAASAKCIESRITRTLRPLKRSVCAA